MLEDLIKQIVEQTVVLTLQKLSATDIKSNDMPEIMDTRQLAEYLNVSTSYIYQNKGIPFKKIGKKLIFHKPEIDAWLESRKNEQLPINKTLIKAKSGKIYKIS